MDIIVPGKFTKYDHFEGNIYESYFKFKHSNHLHGKYMQHYDNHTVKSICYYANGRLEGERRNWYKNGNIESISNYFNNKIIGLSKNWSKYYFLHDYSYYTNSERYYLNLRKLMSLLYFKNRLRLRVKYKLTNILAYLFPKDVSKLIVNY